METHFLPLSTAPARLAPFGTVRPASRSPLGLCFWWPIPASLSRAGPSHRAGPASQPARPTTCPSFPSALTDSLGLWVRSSSYLMTRSDSIDAAVRVSVAAPSSAVALRATPLPLLNSRRTSAVFPEPNSASCHPY